MATSRKQSTQKPNLPTLTRVVLRKLEVQRGALLAPELRSEITHEISLELLKPVKGKSQARIKGAMSLNGKWYIEGKNEPIVSFIGLYEARFVLPQNITYEVAEKWMEDAFYRDSVIAQAIPVANLHMHSQLVMMGLNPHNQKIGYESKSEWNKPKLLPSTSTRSVRKKALAVK